MNQLKAAQSYWTAKRDEAHANLTAIMDGKCVLNNPQERINQLVKEFSDAMSIVSTLELIIKNSEINDNITKVNADDGNNKTS